MVILASFHLSFFLFVLFLSVFSVFSVFFPFFHCRFLELKKWKKGKRRAMNYSLRPLSAWKVQFHYQNRVTIWKNVVNVSYLITDGCYEPGELCITGKLSDVIHHPLNYSKVTSSECCHKTRYFTVILCIYLTTSSVQEFYNIYMPNITRQPQRWVTLLILNINLCTPTTTFLPPNLSSRFWKITIWKEVV